MLTPVPRVYRTQHRRMIEVRYLSPVLLLRTRPVSSGRGLLQRVHLKAIARAGMAQPRDTCQEVSRWEVPESRREEVDTAQGESRSRRRSTALRCTRRDRRERRSVRGVEYGGFFVRGELSKLALMAPTKLPAHPPCSSSSLVCLVCLTKFCSSFFLSAYT